MLVTPRSCVDGRHIIEVLEKIGRDAENVRGAVVGLHPIDALGNYQTWAGDAVRSLRTLITAADVEQLVLTRGYERLLSLPAQGSVLLLNLVEAEIEDRIDAFRLATTTLRAEIERWSSAHGAFVVADTNVYVEHPEKLEDVDLAPLMGLRGEEIHLLVPMVVVDELDGLKKSSNQQTRWRAGYTLAVLDRVFNLAVERSTLREADFSALGSGGLPRGAITVELVLDPPGHTRLSINDEELIDRVLALEPLVGRPITLLTYDTGQSTRARAAGLKTIKLSVPLGEEPIEPTKTRRKPN